LILHVLCTYIGTYIGIIACTCTFDPCLAGIWRTETETKCDKLPAHYSRTRDLIWYLSRVEDRREE
jgi:hypothetical protein